MYGHAFNSDTRTILTLLDISKIAYDYEEIDIFMGKHLENKFLEINPSGSIPVIIDEDCQLMGTPNIFANYLTAKFKKLHSYMPPEHKAKIDQHMNWFLSQVRPAVQRLIKVMIGPKAFGHAVYSGEEVENAKAAFLD